MQNSGTAPPERRAEDVGVLPNRIPDCRVTLTEFPAHFLGAFESQKRMRESVIAYSVAGLHDAEGDIGAQLRVAPDHEKSGAHVVLREYFQQTQRVRIVGPVVVGEGDLLRPASKASESAAIPLPGRP